MIIALIAATAIAAALTMTKIKPKGPAFDQAWADVADVIKVTEEIQPKRVRTIPITKPPEPVPEPAPSVPAPPPVVAPEPDEAIAPPVIRRRTAAVKHDICRGKGRNHYTKRGYSYWRCKR